MPRTSPLSPNQRLRALLDDAGCTYDALAREINMRGAMRRPPLRLSYNRSAVAHWLSGTKPRSQVAVLLVEALSRRLGRDVTLVEAGLAPSPPEQDADVASRNQIAGPDCTPCREQHLPSFTPWLRSEGQPWERSGAPDPGARRVGAAELATAESAVLFFGRQARFAGTESMGAALSFLLDDVDSWLRASATARTHASLLTATSQLCFLVARMWIGAGEAKEAQQYFHLALDVAGEAGDTLTYALVLRALSSQSFRQGHPGQAEWLASAALDCLPATAEPARRAYLLAQSAVTKAAAGDRRATLRDLCGADRQRARAGDGDGPFTSYAETALAYQRGEAMAALGDVDLALRAYDRSLRLREPEQHWAIALTHTRLAELSCSIPDVERAVLHAREAVRKFPHLYPKVVGMLQRRLWRALAPYRSTAAVQACFEGFVANTTVETIGHHCTYP
ncbi:tetratricopeptide repeat protein [Streptomyces sp. NBC_01477]|uniref:tetratricopeptide repeat protein n=1 Tax=Streptomyces sp. NBC_01477 TaxID=2976015 RepID=UPI002E340599|nr:tetratricopeptide repeat protein [Streptomyces sp. NBC_01477]